MKQLVGKKRLNQCVDILKKNVLAGFMNDNVPHGMIQAWTSQKDAYLINPKRKSYVLQILDGKLRVFRPRVFVRVGDVKLTDTPKLEPIGNGEFVERKAHTTGCLQRSFAEAKCTCFQDESISQINVPVRTPEAIAEETWRKNRAIEIFGQVAEDTLCAHGFSKNDNCLYCNYPGAYAEMT